jgi:uncharacterized integral membrane protein
LGSGGEPAGVFRRPPALVWLYVFIVLVLGATLVTGVVSWVWLTFEDRALPAGLATVLATIAGGLVGALTAGEMGSRGSRRDDPDD